MSHRFVARSLVGAARVSLVSPAQLLVDVQAAALRGTDELFLLMLVPQDEDARLLAVSPTVLQTVFRVVGALDINTRTLQRGRWCSWRYELWA